MNKYFQTDNFSNKIFFLLLALCILDVVNVQWSGMGVWNLNKTIGWQDGVGLSFLKKIWTILFPLAYWILQKRKFKIAPRLFLTHTLVILLLVLSNYFYWHPAVDHSLVFLNWILFFCNILFAVFKK